MCTKNAEGNYVVSSSEACLALAVVAASILMTMMFLWRLCKLETIVMMSCNSRPQEIILRVEKSPFELQPYAYPPMHHKMPEMPCERAMFHEMPEMRDMLKMQKLPCEKLPVTPKDKKQ